MPETRLRASAPQFATLMERGCSHPDVCQHVSQTLMKPEAEANKPGRQLGGNLPKRTPGDHQPGSQPGDQQPGRQPGNHQPGCQPEAGRTSKAPTSKEPNQQGAQPARASAKGHRQGATPDCQMLSGCKRWGIMLHICMPNVHLARIELATFSV